ncbi:unnamed protein product [Bemisia tabaci]|uniref:Uncharacterized protein n=1 Tax=Bemisia tabaci TaxID=7038 RepID=A0A9P0EXD5_BEMTA|nr:unnamed protein product [Bemisia tabaci]
MRQRTRTILQAAANSQSAEQEVLEAFERGNIANDDPRIVEGVANLYVEYQRFFPQPIESVDTSDSDDDAPATTAVSQKQLPSVAEKETTETPSGAEKESTETPSVAEKESTESAAELRDNM